MRISLSYLDYFFNEECKFKNLTDIVESVIRSRFGRAGYLVLSTLQSPENAFSTKFEFPDLILEYRLIFLFLRNSF